MAAQVEALVRTSDERFLARETTKTLLRFTTAGSVDDGKSTLIGRLLYDSHSVYEDQVNAIAKYSANRGNGALDLSLLTDGLRAERDQGITIDVAYRYFSTARRKFIIADTPGHEQYTRNMATGASTADLAIILLDARKGVLPQSKRHAYIASLLGIPHIVAAVNKMDAVGYDESVFTQIQADFHEILTKLGSPDAFFLPLSALTGDNVVKRSVAMPWFSGPSLLEYLETVEVASQPEEAPFRLPIQYVIRPNQDFRGYAGQIASGSIRPGQEVAVYPSGRTTRIKSIAAYEGNAESAQAPASVTITLEDEIDISRGDLIASRRRPALTGRLLEADLVWMSEAPLDRARPLLLKHTTQTVKAQIRTVHHRVDLSDLSHDRTSGLLFNDIGRVLIETAKPLFFDPYARNRVMGSFVLIDPETNATVAAGMIRGAEETRDRSLSAPVTRQERTLRNGHKGAIVPYGQDIATGEILERRLFSEGCSVVNLIASAPGKVLETLAEQGLLVLIPGNTAFTLPEEPHTSAAAIYQRLQDQGVLAPGNQE